MNKPDRDWDAPEQEYLDRIAAKQQSMAAHIEAEISWIENRGPEPAWPQFVPKLPYLEYGRRDRFKELEERIHTISYADSQGAALWLTSIEELLDVPTNPWLIELVATYKDWTKNANGFGFDPDDHIDGEPDEWNAAYLKVAALPSSAQTMSRSMRSSTTICRGFLRMHSSNNSRHSWAMSINSTSMQRGSRRSRCSGAFPCSADDSRDSRLEEPAARSQRRGRNAPRESYRCVVLRKQRELPRAVKILPTRTLNTSRRAIFAHLVGNGGRQSLPLRRGYGSARAGGFPTPRARGTAVGVRPDVDAHLQRRETASSGGTTGLASDGAESCGTFSLPILEGSPQGLPAGPKSITFWPIWLPKVCRKRVN